MGLIDGFEDWLTPAQALDLLPLDDWGRGHCTNAIITNLKIEAVQAVARFGLLASGDPRSVQFHPIPGEYWDDGLWVRGSEALWVTGQVSFHQGSKLGEMLGRYPDEWIEHVFSDVRFDPAQFASAFDLSGAQRLDDEEAPLSDRALDGWADLFRQVYPNGSEALARRSLEGMFPGKTVSRDRLRRILPPIRRGRPLKERD